MDAEFVVDRNLNEKLDQWCIRWNQPSPEEIRRRAVNFLEEWRGVEGDWFTDVANRLIELTAKFNYRTFNWKEGFEGQIQKLLFANHTLWHFEDEVRRDDITSEKIVELKRGIDAVNQQRNNQMEKLDEYILGKIDVSSDGDVPIQSEPPGLILDRMTIMSLKQFHYDKQDKRKQVLLLKQQRADLETAFNQLIEDLKAGRRRVKIYRQLKTYNDPETNPALD